MTSIKEEENNTINISKYNFSCDDEDPTIPEPLPRKSFSMLITGRPGSGKTNLLLNLITKRGKCLNRKFDKVYIWSPSWTCTPAKFCPGTSRTRWRRTSVLMH